jgi:LCP family protein required for cell wall assembly
MSDSTPTRGRVSERRRTRGRRAFLVLAAALSVLLVVGSGFAIGGIYYYDGQLTKVSVGTDCTAKGCLRQVTPECLRGACNYLVLGSDSRAELSQDQQGSFGDEEKVEGQRADTIIVVHQDPNRNETVVLHIPRDLRVRIAGVGMGKINAAYESGPDKMVETVESLTGLSINHYISVNFAGFIRVVNALGGVNVCIDRPLIDKVARLNLPRAGCYELSGGPALAFVRARHIQGDSIPDFSRISRQQQFIRAVINKILSPSSTLQFPRLIAAAQHNLLIDENLGLYDLRDLTNELAEVGQEGVTFRVTPAVPVEVDDISYLELVQPKANQLFERIREGRDLGSLGKQEPLTPPSPADVTVQVFDADSGGDAEEVADYLGKAGFAVVGVKESPPDLMESRVLYSTGFGKQKEVVSSYLPLMKALFVEEPIPGADITVVVAPDFPGISP